MPTSDFMGGPRINGNAIDVGAYEFTGAPESIPLLVTPNDSLVANKEFTDNDGWTNYYKDCQYLMSVKKRGRISARWDWQISK